ncbi:MAG: DUF1501 domain-containing protein [Pirellulales bacterium]
MITRRQLLKRSLLVSLSPVVPAFLTRTAGAAETDKDGRVLVVIQLDGGNDGLNTVVPYRDENYARLRPKLKLPQDRLIKLNDELALHASMKAAGELFEHGRLTIVQGVGYPNPNRSHFRSMAIWHTARLDEAEHGQYGWLGRALDTQAATRTGPHAVYSSLGSVPLALWGRRSATIEVKSKDELALDSPVELLQAATSTTDECSQLARRVSVECGDAFATCERLAPILAGQMAPGEDDGPTRLAAHLSIISALIKAGTTARVYYAAQRGYDTHASQTYEHARLLREFAGAVKTFLDDLAASGLADRVLVLAFSEFGRRAAENASEGTDHGAAAPVFIAGPNLASPIIGPAPNLSQLKDGDVEMAVDFRQVYATILRQWLGVPPAEVLGAAFDELALFRA